MSKLLICLTPEHFTDTQPELYFSKQTELDDGWYELEDKINDKFLAIHISEIAGIPQVKVLIEALNKSSNVLGWASRYFDRQEMIDTALNIEKIKHENDAALNAFKCLPDDK